MPELPKFIDNRTLRVIRDNADWQAAFRAFGLARDDRKSKEGDWWAHSPLADEKTASFHINAKGWFCFSTNQGGGIVELVQKVLERRTGRAVNCYEAGRWMLEQGISRLDQLSAAPAHSLPAGNEGARSEKKEKGDAPDSAGSVRNAPIRADLIPRLVPQHPMLEKRGISKATCKYLGCGYLSGAKGTINNRIVFQVRGVEERGGHLSPVILTHIGRAVSDVQADVEGKWHHYHGFQKHLELYNIDKLLLDPQAREQARRTGRIILVEGPFDVAKLVEAGIRNVVATFGAHCSTEQARRLKFLAGRLGITDVLLWYDKDAAGRRGRAEASPLIEQSGLKASPFWWGRKQVEQAGVSALPATAKDPCDLPVPYLQVLRNKGVI